MLEKFTDTLLYFVPALLVLGGVYLTLKKYLDNDYRLRLLETRSKAQKDVLPLRFQAYERLCLFLERISPASLLPRSVKPGMTARDLHQELLLVIRTEIEHNLSQQVYVSSKAWDLVKAAKEETTKIINVSASGLGPDATATQLSRAVFDIIGKNGRNPTDHALEFLKKEVRQLF